MTVTYLYYKVCDNSCQHKVLSDEIHYHKQKKVKQQQRRFVPVKQTLVKGMPIIWR